MKNLNNIVFSKYPANYSYNHGTKQMDITFVKSGKINDKFSIVLPNGLSDLDCFLNNNLLRTLHLIKSNQRYSYFWP